jgi:uncharacterized protein
MTRHSLFLVPALDRWLLYAPLHGVAAVVNAVAARELRRGDAARLEGPVEDLGRPLRVGPSNPPAPPSGELCPPMLGILPTRGCNLACAYCDFGSVSPGSDTMSPATAVAAVDWMAQRMQRAGRRSVRVHFFGGEPLLAPEVVAVAVHRVRLLAGRYGFDPYVDASTNGVFNAGFCEFVGDYFNGIAVSLDGPPEIHDRVRPRSGGQPTFEDVDRTVSRLSRMPVDLRLRVCVTERSVGELEGIVSWMIDRYKPSAVNVETLTPGVESAKAGLKPPDPYRFAGHCVAAYRVADETGVPVVYAAAERDRPRLSFCPLGTDAVIVSPGGRISACYLPPTDWRAHGLDLDVGRIDAHGAVAIDDGAVGRVREVPLLKPRCKRCFCQWTCAGGCHVNETYPGSAAGYSSFCIQTRLITACLLLRDAGCGKLADALLEDRQAMERLAHHARDPFDTIGDEHAAGAAREPAPWRQDEGPFMPSCGSPS